ncbi:hypothetical protein FACS189419_05810 [Planctomycetales bacterium]|nr:hypothetical protein FACS189419_05810 [Planctomycetales bacterium]
MFLSVIIPVRNESEHIADVLNSLLAQNYDEEQFEILVCDGMSTDNTPQIVQSYCSQYPNVRYFENPKRLACAARNIGVQNAQGDAVLIVDGHCIIDNPDMLANVAKTFEESGADCLGRPQPLEMKDATAIQWAIAAARRSPLGHHADSFIYSNKAQFVPASSVAIAYRKSVFGTVFNEQGGYFDETFDACEDVEFNTRCDKAGLKCWFDPAIAVRYVPRKTINGLMYQLFRYGQGRVRLARKHRDTFSLKTFAPGLFVLFAIAGYFLSLLNFLAIQYDLPVIHHFWFKAYAMSCVILLGGVLGVYLLSLFIESFRIANKINRLSLFPLLPHVFLTIHIGFGWGIVKEFFTLLIRQK